MYFEKPKKIQKNIAEFNEAIWSNTKFTYNTTEYEGKLVLYLSIHCFFLFSCIIIFNDSNQKPK